MVSRRFEKIWQLLSTYDFKDEIPEKFHCTICKDVTIEPYTALCECRFCANCIKEYLKDGKKNCIGGKKECMEEQLEINVNVSKDIGAVRIIGRFLVNCPNDNLCEQRCQLERMSDHLKECGGNIIQCPYETLGCEGGQFTLENMKSHYDSECSSHSQLLVQAINNLKNDFEGLKKLVKRKDHQMTKLNEESENKKVQINRNSISTTDKERIIEAYSTEQDWPTLCESLGVNYRTAQGIIRRWNASGVISKGKRGGHKKPHISPDIGSALIDFIQCSNSCTLNDMRGYLRNEHSVDVSVQTISRYLQGKSVTRKTMDDKVVECKMESRKNEGEDFFSDNAILFNQCIYIGESDFNLRLKRPSTNNSRDIEIQRGTTISLCMALSAKGIIIHKIKLGSFNATSFQEFFSELSLLIGSDSYQFLMDDRRIHRGVTSENSNHKVSFVPPNSQFLAPIEVGFNILKKKISKRMILNITIPNLDLAQRRQNLIEAMNEEINALQHTNFEQLYQKDSTLDIECNPAE